LAGVFALDQPCGELVAWGFSKVFVEIVLAPSFTQEALVIFSRVLTLGVLEVGNI
jgi:AICAR transformylase/IMP cyclohydrolase PurH (only IMP cyclohydrolase domain in Aful)